jgi:hypothetical protein
MRTRTGLFAVAALAALVVGCGVADESDDEVFGTGGAVGTGGAGGSTGGTGGVGGAEAGPDGTAGTGGTDASAGGSDSGTGGAGGTDAGPDGTVDGADGTSGTGGATGGTGGTGGIVPPVDACEGKTPQMPLPYAVETNFKYANNITPMAQINVLRWVNVGNPDCDMVFSDSGLPAPPPEFNPPPAEAGADDGGSPDAPDDVEASVDDGAAEAAADDAEASTDDGAAEASADDGATSDASGDASQLPDATTGDGGAPACWGFYYNPDNCANLVADGSTGAPLWQCWGGVIYGVAPPNTTPAPDGICIAAGATGIEFWARASRDGARIKFGSTREGLDLTEFWLNITTTWTKYTIGVAPDYRTPAAGFGVSNGFSVVVEPADHVGGTYIFVKDMKWVGPAANDGG